MAIFRRQSSRRNKNSIMNSDPVPIQRSNNLRQKQDIHDPILTAIHDAQPFEESMAQSNHYRTVSSPDAHFRDVFGRPITDPDRSNPTRPRNERPLDTIRSFEYACTMDNRIKEEMETPTLGWNTRANFSSMPSFESNPYQNRYSGVAPQVISFDQPSTSNYMRSEPPAVPAKKKKRGLFGRKKD